MCGMCDYSAREVVWCEVCDEVYDRPCPRCGGQMGCPLGHNSNAECFWCASGLGPAADLPVLVVPDDPVKRKGRQRP